MADALTAVTDNLVLVIFVGGIYLLPTIIGFHRRKQNIIPIALGNVFLGWTVIGWAIMLLEAFTGD
jgi:hypothetical protein